MADYKAHEASRLFPLLNDDDLKAMAADIKAHGLRDPIALYDGQILDGRNRLAACKLAKVTPTYEELDLGAVPSPVEYVISKNLRRRHLTTSQRATIAADMVKMLAEEAEKRMKRGKATLAPDGAGVGRSSETAAKALGVGHTSVDRALRAKKEHPKLFEKAKRGELSVTAASEGRKSRTRGYRGIRKDKTAPYDPKTKGQHRIAAAQKKRMEAILSSVRGSCWALAELDVEMAKAVCDAREKKIWAKMARSDAQILNSFVRKLET